MGREGTPERIYTDADRIEVRTLLLDGLSDLEVSRRLSIPRSTVGLWHRSMAASGTEYSERLGNAEFRLADRFDGVISDKLDRIEEGEEEISMQQAIVGAGVFRDKAISRAGLALKTGLANAALQEFKEAVLLATQARAKLDLDEAKTIDGMFRLSEGSESAMDVATSAVRDASNNLSAQIQGD